jgi:hypothetical protein
MGNELKPWAWNDLGEEGVRLIRERFVAHPLRWLAPAWSDEQQVRGELHELIQDREKWFGRKTFLFLTPDLKVIPIPADKRGQSEQALPVLKEVVNAFDKLPESQRKPQLAKRERQLVDPNLVLDPPKGTLKLRTFHRVLQKDGEGNLVPRPEKQWAPIATNDIVWVPQSEWKSVLPANPRKGERCPQPEHLRNRLVKYGFHPYYMLENGVDRWVGANPQNFRTADLTLTVTDVSGTTITMDLAGSLLIEGKAKPAGLDEEVPTGFEGRVRGVLVYDTAAEKIQRFDVVAVGEYWGARTHRRVEPRTLVGFAIELATGDWAADFTHPERVRSQPSTLRYLSPIE